MCFVLFCLALFCVFVFVVVVVDVVVVVVVVVLFVVLFLCFAEKPKHDSRLHVQVLYITVFEEVNLMFVK